MAELEEYQHIEIVIELDKGRSIEEVAEQFGVSSHTIRKLAVISGMRPLSKRKSKRAKLLEEDIKSIIERIEEGALLEEIALDFHVSPHTIRQVCKREGVIIPRALHHLKRSELQEIRELLAANESIIEIARTYNLAYATVESLQEEYKQLDVTALGFLYEIFQDHPEATPQALKRLAKKAGFEVKEHAILSYQQRLKKLQHLQ